MMEWLSDPTIWLGLSTLILLEIVLGIDNLVFIAILADKLPPEQRDKARLIGLGLALIMRVGLLFALSWIMGLTATIFELFGKAFSWRDVILITGGFFLIFKATMELHERLEGSSHQQGGNKAYASFGTVIAQIVVLDAVFSLDSVITAVGMVDQLGVMIAAVIIAVGVMMLASKPLTSFVGKHPTVVVLCLGFLLMIGFSLVADGLGLKIPKGYLYAAIAFSVLVEGYNQFVNRKQDKRERRIPLRERTANGVLNLLGARPSETASAGSSTDGEQEQDGLVAAEHDMIRSVLTLGQRSVGSVMTVRADLEWINTRHSAAETAERLIHSPHTRLLVCDGELDRLQGVVQSRDLLAALLADKPLELAEHLREPLILSQSSTALHALEQIREQPVPLAVVVDEYGSIQGIVTANDLLAAIAGDLADTRDAQFATSQQADGSWIIDASMSMEDLEQATTIALPRNRAYVSVSGLFLHQLQRLPEVGDRIEIAGHTLQVLDLERRRVGRASIRASQ